MSIYRAYHKGERGEVAAAETFQGEQVCELSDGVYHVANLRYAPAPITITDGGEALGEFVPQEGHYLVTHPAADGKGDLSSATATLETEIEDARICGLSGEIWVARMRYSNFLAYIGTILASNTTGRASASNLLASNGDPA
jgi:hypothetical protein